MFQISNQHFEGFRNQLAEEYALRLAARIKERFAAELLQLGIGEQRVLPFVNAAILRAKHYHVDRTLDVELYVDCCVLLGPNFDTSSEYPWAREILCRDELTGTAKMDLIHDYLIFATDRAR